MINEWESVCECVSVIKEPINHSTLKAGEPDAFTLITSGHPITLKHQRGAGAASQESSSPFDSPSVWNVFPCFIGVRNFPLCVYNLYVFVCVF